MKHEEYLEAAAALAERKRHLLATLMAADGPDAAKVETAAVVLKTWGEEHDAMWSKRVADAQQSVNP